MTETIDPFSGIFGSSRGKPVIKPYLRAESLLAPFIEEFEDIVRPLIWIHGGEGVCANELALALACDNQAHGKKVAFISRCSNERWVRNRVSKQMHAMGYRSDIWLSLVFGTNTPDMTWESLAKQCAWKADVVIVEGVDLPLYDPLHEHESTQQEVIARLREYALLEDAAYVICSEPSKETSALLAYSSFSAGIVKEDGKSQLVCSRLSDNGEVLRLDYKAGEGVVRD